MLYVDLYTYFQLHLLLLYIFFSFFDILTSKYYNSLLPHKLWFKHCEYCLSVYFSNTCHKFGNLWCSDVPTLISWPCARYRHTPRNDFCMFFFLALVRKKRIVSYSSPARLFGKIRLSVSVLSMTSRCIMLPSCYHIIERFDLQHYEHFIPTRRTAKRVQSPTASAEEFIRLTGRAAVVPLILKPAVTMYTVYRLSIGCVRSAAELAESIRLYPTGLESANWIAARQTRNTVTRGKSLFQI